MIHLISIALLCILHVEGLYIKDINKNVNRHKRNCANTNGCPASSQLPFIPARTNCVVPEHPDNGKWTMFLGPKKLPGDIVPASTILQFDCDSHYKLIPEVKYSICNTHWTALPICIRTCPTLHSSEILHIGCELHQTEISCTDPYEGSKARVTCASMNEEPFIAIRPYLNCINGSWDAPIPQCKPVSVAPQSRCILPQHPENGKWIVAEDQLIPGDIVGSNTKLTFQCHSGYQLHPKVVTVCSNNQWTMAIPKCLKETFGFVIGWGATPPTSNIFAPNQLTNQTYFTFGSPNLSALQG